jgi:hypothetical protein
VLALLKMCNGHVPTVVTQKFPSAGDTLAHTSASIDCRMKALLMMAALCVCDGLLNTRPVFTSLARNTVRVRSVCRASSDDNNAVRADSDDPLYASLRARLADLKKDAGAPGAELKDPVLEQSTTAAADDDDDDAIPFFAEEERAERDQRLRAEIDELERTVSAAAGNDVIGGGVRTRFSIAQDTVKSLVLLSVGAIITSGVSYGVLGPRFVHERGDMRAMQYQMSPIKRYSDPDALLREEEPSTLQFARTDDLLYNELYDGSLFRPSSESNVVAQQAAAAPAPGDT